MLQQVLVTNFLLKTGLTLAKQGLEILLPEITRMTNGPELVKYCKYLDPVTMAEAAGIYICKTKSLPKREEIIKTLASL